MRIERSVLEAIRGHLQAAYPKEGCGFLIGVRGPDGEVAVRRHVPVENRRSGGLRAGNRYWISPDDLLAVEREAQASGLQIVGVYHSHPDVAARPSAYDREHAWPWYRYLIVSVIAGTATDQRVFELGDHRQRFVEHVLRVEEQ